MGYVNLPGFMPATEIELLLALYTPYEIRNLIFDPLARELDSFDVIIFVSDRNRNGERWLNKDYFIKQLADYNHYQLQEINNKKIKTEEVDLLFGFYILYEGPSSIRLWRNYCLVSKNQLEEVINYFPRLRLINKIDGAGHRGDILIYKRL